jgi:hypothetical protein
MKKLKRDPSIQIISADKWTAIVVMNKDGMIPKHI